MTNKNLASFTQILKNKNFFLLWLCQIISQFGDRLDQMALIGFITQRFPGSTFQMAKLLSFTIIPVFLIGPVAGVYVDRWDKRKTMYISDFLRGILVLLIPLVFLNLKSLFGLYLVIFLSFSVGRFFIPAKLSIVPDLVRKEELLLANSLINTTGMIAAILGFGIGGLIVDWLGPEGGFYINALTFFVSAIFIFFITIKITQEKRSFLVLGKEVLEVIKKSVIQEVKEGLVYLIKKSRMRFIIGILFLIWSALGSIYIVLIVFIQQRLGSLTKDLGLLVVFLGLGLFLGTLFYGRFGQRFSTLKAIFLFLFLSGINLILFSLGLQFLPNFLIAATFAFIFGMSISPIMTASNTLIHKVSHKNMRGKVFSSLEMIMHSGFLLFMLSSSMIAEKISRFWILVIVGIIFGLIGLIGLLRKGETLQWSE